MTSQPSGQEVAAGDKMIGDGDMEHSNSCRYPLTPGQKNLKVLLRWGLDEFTNIHNGIVHVTHDFDD